MRDSLTGEKHIADVRTEHGLVIEFQRSHLPPAERRSREHFYKNIVWVVDGSRLQGDLPRFREGQRSFVRVDTPGVLIARSPEKAFPKAWLMCDAPVVFDFQDRLYEPSRNGLLYCLLPGLANGHAVVIEVGRQEFVRLAASGPQPFPAKEIVGKVAAELLAVDAARLGWQRAWLQAHGPFPKMDSKIRWRF